MQGGWLYRLLSSLIVLLRRLGVPAALRSMTPRECASYAFGIAYMFQARLWTLLRGEPGWPALQAAWARAERDPGVRDTLAGTLASTDRLQLIASGEAGFAAREALYARAVRSLDIATYYVQSDQTGRATMAALAACAARGVRVRLLVDRYMMARKRVEVEGMDALLDEARAAGIEVRAWHDPARPWDSNHRKMIVADAEAALVGGRNFADHYRGDQWRDVDLVLEGPSAAPLARLFEAVWSGAGAPALQAHPAPPWIDCVPAGVVDDPVMRYVLSAVGAATRSVDLELAYFVAHDSLCGALERAARRGVRVRLLTNSAQSNDLPFATWTTYEGARRLLEAGAEVHARRGAGRTLHCKYAVIDGEWVSFGSHNLDYYSPRYCCEANLLARDARLAGLLGEFFADGLAQATPLDLESEVRPYLEAAVSQRRFDRAFRDFQ